MSGSCFHSWVDDEPLRRTVTNADLEAAGRPPEELAHVCEFLLVSSALSCKGGAAQSKNSRGREFLLQGGGPRGSGGVLLVRQGGGIRPGRDSLGIDGCPQQHLGVEQEPHRSKRSRRSSGSGASKSSGTTKRPRSNPSRRCVRLAGGISRATSCPRRVIVISSPPATSRSSRLSYVFASCTPIDLVMRLSLPDARRCSRMPGRNRDVGLRSGRTSSERSDLRWLSSPCWAQGSWRPRSVFR